DGELQPARVEGERGEEPEAERDPGAPAEREVDGRQQQRERRAGEAAGDEALVARKDDEGQERGHRGEDPEAVPVPDWIGEAVPSDGVIGAEAVRDEAPREGGERDTRPR